MNPWSEKKKKKEKKGVLLGVHLKNNFESSNFSILVPVDVAMATLMLVFVSHYCLAEEDHMVYLYNYFYEASIVIYI